MVNHDLDLREQRHPPSGSGAEVASLEVKSFEFPDLRKFLDHNQLPQMPGTLSVWTVGQLRDYVRENLDTVPTEDGWFLVRGFDLTTDGIIWAKHLISERSFAHTVCVDGKMIGSVFCEFKDATDYLPFSHYHLRWVDVHRDWRNQGIASRLLRSLEESPRLAGEVLELSVFTEDGQAYLEPKIQQLMPGRAMTIVPELTVMTERPLSFGWQK